MNALLTNMNTTAIIQDLNSKMKYGDKMKIVKNTGLSKSVVYQFFENTGYPISQDAIEKIVECAVGLIKGREKRADKLQKLVNEL